MKNDYLYLTSKLIEYVCIIFFSVNFGERISSNDINKNNVHWYMSVYMCSYKFNGCKFFILSLIFFGTYKGDEDEEDKKASEEELAKDLHVVSVDVKITENCEKHRTSQYSCTKARKNQDGVSLPPELVVRRGQPFRITVKFNQPFLKEKHGMQIIFITGKNKIKSQNI